MRRRKEGIQRAPPRNSPKIGFRKYLDNSNLQIDIAWNTDEFSFRADPLSTLPQGVVEVAANLEMGKLFTSYSQGVGFLPAVRRETIFHGVSRQGNLPCQPNIYF